jgi:FkbM family methyltransferase
MPMPSFFIKALRKIISFLLKNLPTGKLSDLLLWPVSRRLFSRYSEVVRPDASFALKVYGDTPDMISKSLLFMSGYKPLAWEPVTSRLVKKLSPQIDSAVVAGAHIGYYPCLLATNPKTTVYAFEPNPINHSRLVENANLNDFKNIVTSPLALGEKEEEKKMFFDYGQSSIADSSRDHYGEGVVRITTLDDFLTGREGKLDLLLLDAEGYEPFILRGGESAIRASNPDIILEINPKMLTASGSSMEELLSFVRTLGYELYIIDDDYENYPNNTVEPSIKLLKYTDSIFKKIPIINIFATKKKEEYSSLVLQ